VGPTIEAALRQGRDGDDRGERVSPVHRVIEPRRATSRATGGTIGRRVARILALPAAVVLVLLAVVASGQIRDYRSSEATARSVGLTLALQGLIHELQAERGVTAAVLGGNPSFRNELDPARRAVDAQRAAVQAQVKDGGAVEARVRSAVQQLDGLPAVRAATDVTTAGRAAMFGYFTDRIASLSNVDVGLDHATDDQLRRGAAALQALEDLSEATAQERAFLNGVFSAGGFGKGEFVQFAAMRTAKDAALKRFDRFGSAGDIASAGYVFDTGAARTTAYFEQVAIDAADGRHIVVNPQSWWSGLTTVLDDLRQLQQHVGSEIQVRAHALQQDSAGRIAGLIVAVLLCFGGSIVLAALAAASISRPLAALAAEADSVASNRLPQAVRRVRTGDEDDPPEPPLPVQVPARATREVSSVASALDRLQSAAYELATEQATQRWRTTEALANLGRRNQNLIRRQLGFITSLEREEIDPTALANLFELDHLATRMRRNAASLLVLVGASSPRQWSSPVPVADVIRAAVSEVEEYRRAALRRIDEAQVIGTAVGSVAHLLSELIENGLTFSPPDSEVDVQGRALADGYLIAITDQGIGMSADDLAQANARLRGEGDFLATPTRFLGHFVVGQLARESSIGVELVRSPVVGVTARITLPSALLSRHMSIETGPGAQSAPAARASVTVLEPAPRPASRRLALSQPGEPPYDRDGEQAPWYPAAGEATDPGEYVAEPVADPWAAPQLPAAVSLFASATSATNGTQVRSASPAPTPGPERDDEAVERTRNGLRKRVPRGQRPQGAAVAEDRRVIDLTTAGQGTVVDDSPAEVRFRLMSLRAGVERGHSVRGAGAAASEQPGSTDPLAEEPE
jgi:signal transduction histidine kinase